MKLLLFLPENRIHSDWARQCPARRLPDTNQDREAQNARRRRRIPRSPGHTSSVERAARVSSQQAKTGAAGEARRLHTQEWGQ